MGIVFTPHPNSTKLWQQEREIPCDSLHCHDRIQQVAHEAIQSYITSTPALSEYLTRLQEQEITQITMGLSASELRIYDASSHELLGSLQTNNHAQLQRIWALYTQCQQDHHPQDAPRAIRQAAATPVQTTPPAPPVDTFPQAEIQTLRERIAFLEGQMSMVLRERPSEAIPAAANISALHQRIAHLEGALADRESALEETLSTAEKFHQNLEQAAREIRTLRSDGHASSEEITRLRSTLASAQEQYQSLHNRLQQVIREASTAHEATKSQQAFYLAENTTLRAQLGEAQRAVVDKTTDMNTLWEEFATSMTRTEETLKSQMSEIATLRRALAAAEQAAHEQQTLSNNQIHRLQQQLKAATAQATHFAEQMESLADAVEQETRENSAIVAQIQADLDSARVAQAHSTRQIEGLEAQLRASAAQQTLSNNQIHQLTQQLAETTVQADQASGQISLLSENLAQANHSNAITIRNLQESLDAATTSQAAAEQQVDELTQQLSTARQTAREQHTSSAEEIRLLTQKLEAKTGEAAAAADTITSLRKEIKTARAATQQSNKRAEELQTRLSTVNREAQAAAAAHASTLAEATTSIEQLKGRMKIATARNSQLETALAETTAEINAFKCQGQEAERTAQAINTENEQLRRDLASLRQQLASTQSELTTATHGAQAAETQSRQLQEELARLQKQSETDALQSLSDVEELTVARANIGTLQRELDQVRQEAAARIAQLEGSLSTTSSQIDATTAQINQLISKQREAEARAQLADTRTKELERELAALRAQLEATQDDLTTTRRISTMHEDALRDQSTAAQDTIAQLRIDLATTRKQACINQESVAQEGAKALKRAYEAEQAKARSLTELLCMHEGNERTNISDAEMVAWANIRQQIYLDASKGIQAILEEGSSVRTPPSSYEEQEITLEAPTNSEAQDSSSTTPSSPQLPESDPTDQTLAVMTNALSNAQTQLRTKVPDDLIRKRKDIAHLHALLKHCLPSSEEVAPLAPMTKTAIPIDEEMRERTAFINRKIAEIESQVKQASTRPLNTSQQLAAVAALKGAFQRRATNVSTNSYDRLITGLSDFNREKDIRRLSGPIQQHLISAVDHVLSILYTQQSQVSSLNTELTKIQAELKHVRHEEATLRSKLKEYENTIISQEQRTALEKELTRLNIVLKDKPSQELLARHAEVIALLGKKTPTSTPSSILDIQMDLRIYEKNHSIEQEIAAAQKLISQTERRARTLQAFTQQLLLLLNTERSTPPANPAQPTTPRTGLRSLTTGMRQALKQQPTATL